MSILAQIRQVRHKENSMISPRHLEAEQNYIPGFLTLPDWLSLTNHAVSEADSSHSTGDYAYFPPHPSLCAFQKPLLS